MAVSRDLLIRLIAKDEASVRLAASEGSLDGLKTAAAGFGIGLSAGALAKGVYDLTVIGAQAQQVEQSFQSLSASAGQSSAKMLESLKAASRGTIAETDLMKAANFAILAGGSEMASELPALMDIARAASIGLGEDMGFMFDSIVKGIARGSPLILDNLGLIVSLEEANESYAEQLGIDRGGMTEQQKTQALLNDIMAQAPAYIDAVGASSMTTAEGIRAMEVSTSDLKSAWGKLLVTVGDTSGFTAAATEAMVRATQGITEWADVVDKYGAKEGIKADWKRSQAQDELKRQNRRGDITDDEFEKLMKASQSLYQYIPGAMDDIAASAANVHTELALIGAEAGSFGFIQQNAGLAKESVDELNQALVFLNQNAGLAPTQAQGTQTAMPYIMGMPDMSYGNKLPGQEVQREMPYIMGVPDTASIRSFAEQAVGGINDGFGAALAESNPADQVLGSMQTQVEADAEYYKLLGMAMGTNIGTATKTAIVDDVGNIRSTIAGLVAPEVARILATNAGEAQP